MPVFLFDLDMTLVDSSAVEQWRREQKWDLVRMGMGLVRPFGATGGVTPHHLPGLLKRQGHTVGIVTSSPEWYARAVLTRFTVPFDVLVSHGDTQNHKPDPEPLLEALRRLGVTAQRGCYYVGDDAVDVEAAFHAGLTSVGVKWGTGDVSRLASSAPDVFIAKPSRLLAVDRLPGRGYLGELLTSGGTAHTHWGSVLRCGRHPSVYALGRYFTTSDVRHATSTLSAAVLSLKEGDSRAAILGEALGRAINLLAWTPNYVVPVPMKPSQTRNRFELLLQAAMGQLTGSVSLEPRGLRCVKEVQGYKGMNPAERAEAMRNAFTSLFNWNGNDILLIDDVFTTGGTTSECLRVLKASGAGEVRIMTLANDQRAFTRRACDVCGRPMRVRTNGTTGQKFWGCSGWPDACRNTSSF